MAKTNQTSLDGSGAERRDAPAPGPGVPGVPGVAEVRAMLRRSRGGWETADDEAVMRFWRGLTEAERREIAERK